jgi:hypothetical protein
MRAFPLILSVVVALSAATARAQVPGAPALVYEWEHPRCAATGEELARHIVDCMGRVMFPRGPTPDGKPEVHVNVAALVCRQSRSAEMSRSLSRCVRGVLYERSGLGARRKDVGEDAAAHACRYATDLPQAENVEACMRRLLFDRGGLGYLRTEVTAEAAAFACQSAAAPGPPPFILGAPHAFTCRPPVGEASVEFIDRCVKSLARHRDGLGERRAFVTPEAAVVACEGALSGYR